MIINSKRRVRTQSVIEWLPLFSTILILLFYLLLCPVLLFTYFNILLCCHFLIIFGHSLFSTVFLGGWLCHACGHLKSSYSYLTTELALAEIGMFSVRYPSSCCEFAHLALFCTVLLGLHQTDGTCTDSCIIVPSKWTNKIYKSIYSCLKEFCLMTWTRTWCFIFNCKGCLEI